MAEQTKSKPVWRRARVKIVEKKDKLILNLEVEDISGYGIRVNVLPTYWY